jgi:hypothetical protein
MPDGNGVDIRRLSVPAALAFAVIIASISVAGTFAAIWSGFLGRLAAVEGKPAGVSRQELIEWCLTTEIVNPGWHCTLRSTVTPWATKVEKR